ncbi:response regulator transcription factor [Stenotrophomonas rhizophila]|uniref:response regulator transcription factor n=1 Tax=Stenotrophomonas rhizophila TaxID=216778 RepID=UPI001E2A802B|nr:response regulator transcription factor [Stenotrophomonas rhizophila]
MKIVVLEDDRVLRDCVLLPRLRDHGFAVDGLASAAELLACLQQQPVDIAVIDAGLPDADGFELVQSLRRRYPPLGLLMLTGRASVTDQMRGLSSGADAYLAKPVDISLLAATLHSLARRLREGRQPAAEAVPDGGWRLDAGGWRLLSPLGCGVNLTRSERPLLQRLIAATGEVVLREELISTLTDDVFEFDTHRLDSMIHRLRRKVANGCGLPLPLTSVHGEGYVFIA